MDATNSPNLDMLEDSPLVNALSYHLKEYYGILDSGSVDHSGNNGDGQEASSEDN